MKRFVRTPSLATLAAVALTLPLAAQDRQPIGMADRSGHQVAGLLRCLRGLDLSDTQKSDIKAVLEAARPTVQADADAIQAARQKLSADYQAGADKSVLGQDYINLRAALKKLHDDGAATKEQVLGKLSDSQKATAEACFESHHGAHGMHRQFED